MTFSPFVAGVFPLPVFSRFETDVRFGGVDVPVVSARSDTIERVGGGVLL